MDVLVGHATAHGSTRQIAERVAAELRRAGLAARARPMAEVDDADTYEAFVLGSAVHNQRWLTPAAAFIRDNRDVLGMRPVWIFSVGMPAALRGPWKRLVTKEVPVIERDLPAGLAYRGHRLFSGVLTPAQLPRAGRIFFRVMGGRFGDYRDWDAIDAWTAEIAAELTPG
ncbi:flavodoxin domain-containing protein [Streptomyces sp. SID5643]|uniref:flavodoxin domain-containing protein n=1 Tax=Streptomyces sp. SID5643 TaxID=2690307 RepID=UPI00136E277C|nr:flavodoxin domain-containing protein [Streptomyces sp. SID5643]MZF87798.1 flavodoxin [Streptomyces sp. SID5643]